MGIFTQFLENAVDGTSPTDSNPLANITAAEWNALEHALNRVRGLHGGGAVVLDDYDSTGGTDYTQALRDAIADAVAQAKSSGSYLAEVLAFPKEYVFAGGLQQGGAAKANAQIALPYGDPTVDKKLTLAIRCLAPLGAPWSTANQDQDQNTGCVFRSTLAGATYSGTYGIPSFIGGPTDLQAGASEFSNLMFMLDNIRVVLPANPSITGIDLSHVSQVDIGGLIVQSAYDNWIFGVGPNVAQPTAVHSYGLIMPAQDNNAWANIRRFVAVGLYIGIGFGEHTLVEKGAAISCRAGSAPIWDGHGYHPSNFIDFTVEKSRHAIVSSNPASGGIQTSGGVSHVARIMHRMLRLEDSVSPTLDGTWQETFQHLIDPSNQWKGNIQFMRTSPGASPFEPTTLDVIGTSTVTKTSLKS